MDIDLKKSILLDAKVCLSPNYNERPDENDISLIVVHGISLPPGEFGGDYISQLFLNDLNPDDHPSFSDIAGMEVSSHLVIRRDGELEQYVPFNKRAWHAGVSAFDGREGCNDYSIGIELEGDDNIDYTSTQYQLLATVCCALLKKYPKITLDRIVGHSDVAPGRKTDPGPAFKWVYFMGLLKKEL